MSPSLFLKVVYAKVKTILPIMLVISTFRFSHASTGKKNSHKKKRIKYTWQSRVHKVEVNQIKIGKYFRRKKMCSINEERIDWKEGKQENECVKKNGRSKKQR